MTVYQDWFPRSALELVCELESDRLANLAFVADRWSRSEREVVYSERRLRVEDSNPSFLSEQVQATAFVAHPYRIPTIGWPSDIKAWTLADLQNFYHTWYAPNNCTLVLVGDVEPAQVFALVEKYYGANSTRTGDAARCAPSSPSRPASGASSSSATDRIRCCRWRGTRSRPTIRARRR